MSDPQPIETAAAPKKSGRLGGALRGLLRWTKRLAIGLAVVLVFARLTLPLWLAPVLNKGAKGAGLHVSWADLDLSILGLSVDLAGVRVVPLRDEAGNERDAEALRSAEPFALLDDLGADLDVSALLTGTLRAHRVEVGGLEAWVHRSPGGQWNFASFSTGDPGAGEGPDDKEAVAEPTRGGDTESPTDDAIDFTSPIQIASVAVSGVRLHVKDEAVSPTLDSTLELGVLLRDVGHPDRPTRLSVVARAPELLDALEIKGELTGAEASLVLDLNARIDGIGIARMEPYLTPLGLRPSASKLDAGFGLSAQLVPAQAMAQADDAPLALEGTARFGGLFLRADGSDTVTLGEASVEIVSATSGSIHIGRLGLEGLTAGAERLGDGTLRVAGIDLAGAPPSGSLEEPEEEDPAEQVDGSSPAGPALRVDLVELGGITATFDDAAVQPAATLELGVSGTVRDVQIGAAVPQPLTLDLTAEIKDAARLTIGGTATLGEGRTTANIALGGEAMTLAALAPYLEAAGLESTMSEAASLGVEVALELASQESPTSEEGGASTSIEATLSNLRFGDSESSFLELNGVALKGLTTGSNGEGRMAALELRGARIPLDLYPGGFAGLGLRSIGIPEGATPREIGIGGGDLTVRDVAWGGASSTATIDGSIELLGVADALDLDATIVTRPGPLDVEAELRLMGSGLRYEGIADLLRSAGIEPLLEDGTLALSANARVKDLDGEIHATALIEGLELQQGGSALVALERVALEQMVAGEAETTIAAVEIRGGTLRASRRADGTIETLGMLIGGAKAAPSDAPEAKSQSAPEAGSPASTAARTPAGEAGAATPARLALTRFQLAEFALEWNDAAVTPEVRTALTLSAEANELELIGNELRPLRAQVQLGVEGSLDELVLALEAASSPEESRADVTIEASGMRPGPLAPYLPADLPVLYEDGRLRAHVLASAAPHADGGQIFSAVLDGVDLRDGEAGSPLLAFDRATIEAPRIDAQGGVFDIAEVSVAGFAFEARRVSDTRIEALGVAYDTALMAPPASEDGAQAAAQEKPESPAEGPAARSAPTAPSAPPTVTLGKLDLGIDRLRYIDGTRADAVPLDLALAMVTPGPQTLLAPDPEDLPAAVVEVVGSLSPLAREIRITLEAEPFAADPGASLRALITGIDGAALARVDPRLAEAVDPSGFTDGSVELGADVRLAAARRSPMDFDLGRGFGAMLSVAPLHIRPTPDVDPTGFDRFDVEIKRVAPESGDMRIASMDLAGIHARIEKLEDGMHVAGLRLPPAPEPVDGEPSEEASVDSEETPAPENGEAPAAAGPEIAIDRLTVSGLDFAFADRTVEPALLLPIADAQLEVERFTTRTLTEKRPFSFRLVVDAGEVELPERSGEDNLLSGVFGSVASMATGAEDSFEMESRRVWDLFEVTGRLSLGPTPRGRVETQLLGLELPAFRGPAAAGGVEIGDGLVDSRVKLRFRDDGGLGINSKTVTNYLSLSEPPDGPISKYLQLPAPLDTVLFLLRNEEGAQELPVRLDIGEGGVGGGQIASLAAQTLGLLVTDAVSSAPLRVLGPLGDIAGALGLGSDAPSAETVTMLFEPGAATLATAESNGTNGDAQNGEQLAALAEALRLDPERRVVLQATLGSGDLETAARIANPPRQVLDQLIDVRRTRKAEIERERAQVAARAKSQLAAGSFEMAEESSEVLRALERERRDTERALDALLARVRPGAERRAGMRTRNAALALGRERMERVRAALLALAGPAASRRVDVRRPRYVEPKPNEPLPERGTVTLTPR